MDLKAVEKAARKIQAAIFKNSNSHSIGGLKSHFRGSGLQFKEHQVYAHGDEIRFIDWKLFAKTNVPYVKTFEEERNVEIIVVIDAAVSMLIGHDGVSKMQVAIELTCLLFLLTKQTKDTVQVIIISDGIQTLPKKTGHEGIFLLMAALEAKNITNKDGSINLFYRPKTNTPSELRIKAITQNLFKRKEVIIFSDFHDLFKPSDIKKIIYRTNLHCFQISSPLDENEKIPFTIFGFQSNTNDHSGDFIQIETKKNINEMQSILGKKFKKINVKERYLENFVKQMMSK